MKSFKQFKEDIFKSAMEVPRALRTFGFSSMPSEEEFKKRKRELFNKYHTDRESGDKEKIIQINLAAEILKPLVKGRKEKPKPVEKEGPPIIGSVFSKIISKLENGTYIKYFETLFNSKLIIDPEAFKRTEPKLKISLKFPKSKNVYTPYISFEIEFDQKEAEKLWVDIDKANYVGNIEKQNFPCTMKVTLYPYNIYPEFEAPEGDVIMKDKKGNFIYEETKNLDYKDIVDLFSKSPDQGLIHKFPRTERHLTRIIHQKK